ncbi:hypothetical protein [Paenibacillus sp. GM2]|uniref:hypothetical protein n=1 Tax=Paenibacillus sp. GM2 TaxID=1622070 RepID=UPI00083894C2|nr:hypothetical protein [Paenibacillus sp. GM2]
MSKVLDLQSVEAIEICANPECNSEIYFGQPVFKIGHDLVCSGKCLMKMLGAKTVIAGRDTDGGRVRDL